MTATPDDLRFVNPLYTVTEAASYLGVPRSTFSSWLRGPSAPGRRALGARPLVTSVEGSRLTVPFVGLAEGMVVAAFRDTGLPLARIRPALERLAEVCGPDHPLASERLVTDGAAVLYDFARLDKQLGLLTVTRAGKRVFHDVIQRYLERIDYEDGWAARVVLPTTEEPVLLADPRRAFGQPIFRQGGARAALHDQHPPHPPTGPQARTLRRHRPSRQRSPTMADRRPPAPPATVIARKPRPCTAA